MRYGAVLSCATLVASVAATASAQEQRRFDVEASARMVYDTNVSRSNATIAALRGVQQEDWIFTPSVNVDILQPFGRQALFLVGSVGYDFYDKNDQFDSERIALRGGAQTVLGPCRTVLAGGLERRQSELRDLALLTTENTETVTSVSADAVCARSAGLGLMASASQKWADNSASSRVASDYTDFTTMAGVVYQRPTFGELSVFGSYGKIRYDNRLVPDGAVLVRDGYESYGGGVRFTRRLGARIQGTLSGGYQSVRPESSLSDDFEGFTYGADLVVRPSDRVQANLLFSRAVNPSNRVQTVYAVEDTYQVEATYALGSRIKVGLGAAYIDAEYEGVGLLPGLALTEEEVRRFFGSVSMDVGRRFAVKLDATQEERDANVPGFDYTSNRVGLSLVAKIF